jgi:tRNA A37 threonylcarbamoyladenosine dehydratase
MTDLLQDDEYERLCGLPNYGEDSFSHYENSHVMVIGIGGVGSWAVEALARTGVGELTLRIWMWWRHPILTASCQR